MGSSIIVSLLKMRKLRPRGVKKFVHDHTANRLWTLNLNPGRLGDAPHGLLQGKWDILSKV